MTGPRRQRPDEGRDCRRRFRDGLLGTGVFVNLYAGQSFRHRLTPPVRAQTIMNGHDKSAPPNWRLGFTLALTTAALWGLLPIALKVVLEGMDAYTIVWWRFAAAMAGLGAFLALRGAAAAAARHGPHGGLALLAVATLTLIGNFVLYLVALDHTTPSVTQVVIQLAPLLLLIGGVLVFRERFVPRAVARFRRARRGPAALLQRAPAAPRAPVGGPRPRRRADAGRRRVLGDLRARAEAAAAAFHRAAGALDDLRRRHGPAAPAGAHPAAIRWLDGLQLGMFAFCCAQHAASPTALSSSRSTTGTCRASAPCSRPRRSSPSARCGWSSMRGSASSRRKD